MQFLHNDREEQLLSLHDCRANRAELRDGVLSFRFEEGFWVTQSHPENPTGKTVRTGPGRVDYVLREADGDDVAVEVFTRLRWPRIVECWLWFPRKPYHKECRLKLDVQGVFYRWNDLCPEKEW